MQTNEYEFYNQFIMMSCISSEICPETFPEHEYHRRNIKKHEIYKQK